MPTRSARIGLIGDFNRDATAHRAIPLALRRAAADLGVSLHYDWLPTARLSPVERTVASYSGLWCVPASPYADTSAAIAAIRYARERCRPFLGTCGGFQHAMLEYARHALGMRGAVHAEMAPGAPDPLIAPLSCSMVERTGAITLVPESRLARAYGATETVEGYHCTYGLAPRFEAMLRGDPLRVTGHDPSGEVRAVELEGHPFFVATLFQPERRALRGKTPPIVRAFLSAAAS